MCWERRLTRVNIGSKAKNTTAESKSQSHTPKLVKKREILGITETCSTTLEFLFKGCRLKGAFGSSQMWGKSTLSAPWRSVSFCWCVYLLGPMCVSGSCTGRTVCELLRLQLTCTIAPLNNAHCDSLWPNWRMLHGPVYDQELPFYPAQPNETHDFETDVKYAQTRGFRSEPIRETSSH